MTKAPTPAEMSKGQGDNTNNATKKFEYTAVAERLRTVSWRTLNSLDTSMRHYIGVYYLANNYFVGPLCKSSNRFIFVTKHKDIMFYFPIFSMERLSFSYKLVKKNGYLEAY